MSFDKESKPELSGIVRSGRTFNPRCWRLSTQAKTPAYRQALNLAWYRAGRCGYDPRCGYSLQLRVLIEAGGQGGFNSL